MLFPQNIKALLLQEVSHFVVLTISVFLKFLAIVVALLQNGSKTFRSKIKEF